MPSISVLSARPVAVSARPGPSCGRQAGPRRLAVLAYKSEEATAGAADTAAAAPADQQQPNPAAQLQMPLNSYDQGDFGGYEAGAQPQAPDGYESSGEGPPYLEPEAGQQSAEAEAYAKWVAETAGDWMASEAGRQRIVCEEVLESLDGMVGNYEVELLEKQIELVDAAEDYKRILAELQQLEEAAGGAAGRSAAGGGATSAAEAGEGAGVVEVE